MTARDEPAARGHEPNPAQTAHSLAVTLQDIDAALAPIIGSRGVAALYQRSLHLAAKTHPWLAGAHEFAQAAIDFAALKSVVAQQSDADAALGSHALLQTFHQLLGSLIGAGLTERLLRDVLADASRGAPAHDTTP
jgi:hypothetical protein